MSELKNKPPDPPAPPDPLEPRNPGSNSSGEQGSKSAGDVLPATDAETNTAEGEAAGTEGGVKRTSDVGDQAEAVAKLDREPLPNEKAEEAIERPEPSIAENSAAFRADAKSDTRELTGNLERELDIEKPPGYETHHIVPKGEYVRSSARDDLHKAQAKLTEHGIGPDEAANGVFLPKDDHRGIHTNSYFEALNTELNRANDEGEAQEILEDIRERIQNGEFNH